jgi:hypothetical protein
MEHLDTDDAALAEAECAAATARAPRACTRSSA